MQTDSGVISTVNFILCSDECTKRNQAAAFAKLDNAVLVAAPVETQYNNSTNSSECSNAEFCKDVGCQLPVAPTSKQSESRVLPATQSKHYCEGKAK